MSKKYGLVLKGVIRVFRKDKEIEGKGKKKFVIRDVWFNVSEKNENGEFINKSTNLLFGRNVDLPENNSVIEIKEAFPVITGDGKYARVAYFVKEWEYAEGYNK